MNTFNIDLPIYATATLESLLRTVEECEKQGIEVCFPVSGDDIH